MHGCLCVTIAYHDELEVMKDQHGEDEQYSHYSNKDPKLDKGT